MILDDPVKAVGAKIISCMEQTPSAPVPETPSNATAQLSETVLPSSSAISSTMNNELISPLPATFSLQDLNLSKAPPAAKKFSLDQASLPAGAVPEMANILSTVCIL